ncbi:MAG: biotin carboxylase N-terminal domain-containing protein [Ramlibacter sp.]|nr:biotin carboxylase N-terminal domain-containing protein [Ramlibacter sp.]
MFKKILIANRGEIACRIARTLRRMGIAAATVHSSADAQALHVREIGESALIGGGPARESYLDIDKVVAAAQRVGAQAIHPGFGFLSENAAFAQRCADAGIAFIGPAPESLILFGDKAAAKRLARSLDIPTAAGLEEPSDDVGALLAAVATLPLPYILKAVAGGGGKAMRVIREPGQARAAIEAAIREGRSSFGDGRLIAERYLPSVRHIEVQILGDGAGNVVHLFDRECSLQRRFQKVVEEAPVTSIAQPLRERLWAHAVALGRAARYLGLGTVEFAVAGDEAVFLEVNPRLQVEHPVTEAVTGLDLVQLQVETVARRRLPFTQLHLPAPHSVAVQARLYAEDAQRGFLPSTGRIMQFDVPATVRVDAGVAAGCEITSHYDPMIAKLIAHGASRAEALAQLRDALAQATVLGVTSNRSFLMALLGDAAVQANEVGTEYIDGWLARQPPAQEPPKHVAVLAAFWLMQQRAEAAGSTHASWGDAPLTGWRLQRGPPQRLPAHTCRAVGAGGSWRIGFGRERGVMAIRVEDEVFDVALPARGGDPQAFTIGGCVVQLRARCEGPQVHAQVAGHELSLELAPLHKAAGGSVAALQGLVRAPMMGIVIGVDAACGQQVAAGDRLGTLESMKMEMAITAPVAGVVAWVGCEARGKVERHQDLFRIEPTA